MFGCCPDEKMQPVFLEKSSSKTKNHHTNTEFLACKADKIFGEKKKTEDMIIKSPVLKRIS